MFSQPAALMQPLPTAPISEFNCAWVSGPGLGEGGTSLLNSNPYLISLPAQPTVSLLPSTQGLAKAKRLLSVTSRLSQCLVLASVIQWYGSKQK